MNHVRDEARFIAQPAGFILRQGTHQDHVLILTEFVPRVDHFFDLFLGAFAGGMQPDDERIGDVRIVLLGHIDPIMVIAGDVGPLEEAGFDVLGILLRLILLRVFLLGGHRRLGPDGLLGHERLLETCRFRQFSRNDSRQFRQLQGYRVELVLHPFAAHFHFDFVARHVQVEEAQEPFTACEGFGRFLVYPQSQNPVAGFQARHVGRALRKHISNFHAQLRVISQRQNSHIRVSKSRQQAGHL